MLQACHQVKLSKVAHLTNRKYLTQVWYLKNCSDEFAAQISRYMEAHLRKSHWLRPTAGGPRPKGTEDSGTLFGLKCKTKLCAIVGPAARRRLRVAARGPRPQVRSAAPSATCELSPDPLGLGANTCLKRKVESRWALWEELPQVEVEIGVGRARKNG